MAHSFEVVDANTTEYRRYNVVGRQLTVRLIHHSDNKNPVAHIPASVNDLIDLAFRDVEDTDMVGINIQSHIIQNDKPMVISFRGKDMFSGYVIWNVFEKSLSRILE